MLVAIKSKAEQRDRYRNLAENACAAYLLSKGWSYTKRGWPDFFVWKDGKIAVVEVKPRQSHPLRRGQLRIMRALTAAGIDCYRYSPDAGFSRLVK